MVSYHRHEVHVILDTTVLLGTNSPSATDTYLLEKATEVIVRTYQYGDYRDDWGRIKQSVENAVSFDFFVDQSLIDKLMHILNQLLFSLYCVLYDTSTRRFDTERDYVLDAMVIESVDNNSVKLLFNIMPLF